MTLAEAASTWLDQKLKAEIDKTAEGNTADIKIIKPAAGYSSCPDHTLKSDILKLLGEHCTCGQHGHGSEHSHAHGEHCTCGQHGHGSHGHSLFLRR